VTRHLAASIRAAYGARTKAEIETAVNEVSVIVTTATTRREPVVSAVALLLRWGAVDNLLLVNDHRA
jgi:hypothetical protein